MSSCRPCMHVVFVHMLVLFLLLLFPPFFLSCGLGVSVSIFVRRRRSKQHIQREKEKERKETQEDAFLPPSPQFIKGERGGRQPSSHPSSSSSLSTVKKRKKRAASVPALLYATMHQTAKERKGTERREGGLTSLSCTSALL